MKFMLVLSVMGGEYAVDTNLSDSSCLFSLSEVQVILEEVIEPQDFDLWCELDTYGGE
jgi:hypothetical protein